MEIKLATIHVLSFACAKESTKEKHTGNDPDSYRD